MLGVSKCLTRAEWTDLAVAAPEIVIGKHRALFRVADLLGLAQLVDQLSGRVVSREGGV